MSDDQQLEESILSLGLNPKQTAFVMHYLECGNATKAMSLAGYRGDEKTLASNASRLLRHDKIKRALVRVYESNGVTPEALLGKLSSIAFGSQYTATEQLRALDIMARHILSTKTINSREGEIVHDQRVVTKDTQGELVEFPAAEGGQTADPTN